MKSKLFIGTQKTIFKSVIKALKELNLSIKKENEKECIILANSSIKIFSWGSDIKITVSSSVWYESTVMVEAETTLLQVNLGHENEYELNIIDTITQNLYYYETFCAK